MADDEYNPKKAGISKEMKKRMNIAENPLDGYVGKVCHSRHSRLTS